MAKVSLWPFNRHLISQKDSLFNKISVEYQIWRKAEPGFLRCFVVKSKTRERMWVKFWLIKMVYPQHLVANALWSAALSLARRFTSQT